MLFSQCVSNFPKVCVCQLIAADPLYKEIRHGPHTSVDPAEGTFLVVHEFKDGDELEADKRQCRNSEEGRVCVCVCVCVCLCFSMTRSV